MRLAFQPLTTLKKTRDTVHEHQQPLTPSSLLTSKLLTKPHLPAFITSYYPVNALQPKFHFLLDQLPSPLPTNPHTILTNTMPRAFGFDGDSAYHESLRTAVLASEAQKQSERAIAERERRVSLGLPAEEEQKKRRFSLRKKSTSAPADAGSAGEKKSMGEKVSNFVFNAGRSTKAQRWGEERVGLGDGEVVRFREGGDGERGARRGELGGHGVAEVVR